MVDTIRSISELNNLFSDNTDGNVTPQDIRDLMVSLMVHGEIGALNKAPITISNTYTALDLDSAGAVGRGLTVDTANKQISGIPVNMKVELSLEVIFKGASGANYDFAVFLDPDGTPTRINRMDASCAILSNSQIGIISVSSTYQLSQNDVLQAAIKGTNGANFEMIRGLLRVRRIGVE